MNKMLYTSLFIALILVSCLLLFQGDFPLDTVLSGAYNRVFGHSSEWNPLLDERIPRLLVILFSGASLAVSGSIMQALFQNPLASPSVLGVSCGGSLAVLLVFILEIHLSHPYTIPIAAFCGCLATLFLIYLLARYKGEVTLYNLILTGIALSSLLIAIQGAILYGIRDQWQLIQTITEWLSGSTLDRNWKHVHMQLPLAFVGLLGCWTYRKEIDILALGEEEAKNLGLDVSRIRWRLFLCVSLLTAGTLASVGFISFFGLVLPHILRKFSGPKNSHLIPLCILGGSVALAAMDLTLRLFHMHAFSIGNISAIIGGFFFLLLLPRFHRREYQAC